MLTTSIIPNIPKAQLSMAGAEPSKDPFRLMTVNNTRETLSISWACGKGTGEQVHDPTCCEQRQSVAVSLINLEQALRRMLQALSVCERQPLSSSPTLWYGHVNPPLDSLSLLTLIGIAGGFNVDQGAGRGDRSRRALYTTRCKVLRDTARPAGRTRA
jgi:hypothetical protein